jgi:Raf kinase inhibitor-like YbhB/YbcL family protein
MQPRIREIAGPRKRGLWRRQLGCYRLENKIFVQLAAFSTPRPRLLCCPSNVSNKEEVMGFALSDMQLKSAAFDDGGSIPARHTGEGKDVSPALSWDGVPDGAASFAVVCHDPDAPLVSPRGTYGFVHWVLYNIPAAVTALDEGTEEYTRGNNDFGREGYGGPMPPNGHGVHRYYFWVLALDRKLEMEAGLTLWELLERIEPHVIGMNRLVGTYERH